MKSTERFKQVIKAYLDQRAKEDQLFAEKYANPKKNIDDCIDYIFSEVKRQGGCGYTDDEVYGMAVHYYDEDNIKFNKVGAPGSVIINQHVELTEEEKAEARAKAFKRYEDEELARIKSERKATRPAKEQPANAKPKATKKEPAAESLSGLLKQLELF